MTTRATSKNKNKKPLQTTLGKASTSHHAEIEIDLSHIRKPINTSIFGLKEVLSLFETATDEVRRYVSFECDVMFECRMCRTIFRSLANFVLHKRNYCRDSYNTRDLTNCRKGCKENDFDIIQPDGNLISKQEEDCVSTPQKQEMRKSNNKKKISAVLQRLLDKRESSEILQSVLNDDISNESGNDSRIEKHIDAVALEKIEDTDSGVFQTMFRNMAAEHAKMEFMRNEVMEIHGMLGSDEAVLGPDGKVLSFQTEKCNEKPNIPKNNLICTICNQKFSTRKTLTYHIKYKHNNTRLVYSCPECSDIFANAWCVFRHLYKIHRKTSTQIRRLRDQIHAGAIRKGQDPNLKIRSDPLLRRTRSCRENVDQENQQWMDNFEEDNDLQMCGGCGRRFERKAALHSHSQLCIKRIAICNTIKENNAKRAQAEDKLEKETKLKPSANNTFGSCIIKGSQRRKPLVSRKHERMYIPSKCVIRTEATQESLSSEECISKHSDSANNNSFISAVNDSHIMNEEENCNKVTIISDSNFSTNIDQTINKNVPSRYVPQDLSEDNNSKNSSSSDDVIYVETIFLNEDIATVSSANAKFVETKEEKTPDFKTKYTENTEIVYDSPAEDSNSTYFENKIFISPPPSQDALFLQINSKDSEKVEQAAPESIYFVGHSNFGDLPKVKLNTKLDSDINEAIHEINIICKNTEMEIEEHKRKRSVFDLEGPSSKVSSSIRDTDSTLIRKASKYMDIERLHCNSCDISFVSMGFLLEHMANHFNYYKYQCRKCSFVSYKRNKCIMHVKKLHKAHIINLSMENIVLPIPNWKTLSSSSDFIMLNGSDGALEEGSLKSLSVPEKLCHDDKSFTEKETIASPTDHEEFYTQNSSSKDLTVIVEDTSKLVTQNMQDPSIRKMVMEVIFGSDINTAKASVNSTELGNSEDNPNSDTLTDASRPIRNRVKTVQKDFLYDMEKILKHNSSDMNILEHIPKEKQKKPNHSVKSVIRCSKPVTKSIADKNSNEKYSARDLKLRVYTKKKICLLDEQTEGSVITHNLQTNVQETTSEKMSVT